ncbi:MAG TPA: hypothetical protein VGI92_00045 [Gemmatimonadales bacterium]|jgi:hypothetical protein
MLSFLVLAAVAIQVPAAPRPQEPIPADAYADSGTARLVARARAARERNERLVTSYTATVTQRMAAGIHALSRDRMLYHQELVARIEWYRDKPSRIEVQGAREAIPVAKRGDQIPDDLDSQVRWMVLNPAEDYVGVFFGADRDGFVYPLSPGAERDYRYAAGDTSRITLPNGHVVTLLELKIKPRRADWRLIEGAIWYDAATYGPVRVIFRPARPYDFSRDATEDDKKDVPAFVNPTAVVRYITLEYGLYEQRWWMPRFLAADLTVGIGSFAGMPARFERTYTDYHVQGGAPPAAGLAFRPAGTVRSERGRRARAQRDSLRAYADTLLASGSRADSVRGDSITRGLSADSALRAARRDSIRTAFRDCMKAARDSIRAQDQREGRSVSVRVRVGANECSQQDSSLVVVIPSDTTLLLGNPQLGRPILEMGDVINEGELKQIGDALGVLPQRPWDYRPQLPHRLSALLENLRYNRVEALSVGLKGTLDFGRLMADGLVRMGVADRRFNFEAGLRRPTANALFHLGIYQRLTAANPDVEPFSLGSSLESVFFQRDDGEYFRNRGVELTAKNSNSGWWEARIYGERQRSASVGTEFSLPHLFNSTHLFRPNLISQDADQIGASLTLRHSRVLSRTVLVGGEASLGGERGDYDFGRGSMMLRTNITPGGPYALALEAAAGTSTGAVPTQSDFYLGGPATLRGYDGAVAAGPAFWRGRVELGRGFPAFRLIVFGDAGWAGLRSDFTRSRPLIGAGFGASFLDGLLRFDLGRATRPPTGWRFDVYFDGAL